MEERRCIRCGSPFLIFPCKSKRFCSRRCYETSDEALNHRRTNAQKAGEARGRQKANPIGTKRGDGHGYVMIKIAIGMVYEHRWVMEQSIGRKLLRTEHVHHINRDKTDNRLANLLLTTSVTHHHHHRGDKKHETGARSAWAKTRVRDLKGRWIPN